MEEFDFQFCDFIEVEMSFFSYNDFINKCRDIKDSYKTLNTPQKRVYKWYVYSRITINNNLKNKIWDYLNFDDISYYSDLLLCCK